MTLAETVEQVTISLHKSLVRFSRSFPWRRLRRTLFAKYVALFLGVVMLALLFSGGFNLYFAAREHTATSIRIQQEQANSAAAKITQFIKEIESQLGWTTQLPWTSATLEQRRLDGLRLLRQVPAITELSQVDAQGREQLRVSRLAMDVVGSQTDFSNEAKFSEAVARKVYYGPVYFRRESEPYMTLALAGSRRDAGVSVAEVNLKSIWDVVSQIQVGQKGQAFVIDGQGRLIAHPDISLVLRNTDLSQLTQVKAARTGTPGAPRADTAVAVDLLGQRVLTAHAPITPLGWFVFVELPEAEANAPLWDTVKRSILLLLAGLSLAGLSGFYLARRMLVPIQALRASATEIGGGRLDQRIAIKTGDELEELANSFNDMAGRLRESYATLEQKVEARTQELARTLEYQTATSSVLEVIARSQGNVQPVLDAIVSQTSRLSGVQDVGILLRDGEVVKALSMRGSLTTLISVTIPAERNNVIGRAVVDGVVVHVLDLTIAETEFPLGSQLAKERGHRTVLSIPLLQSGAGVGVIFLRRTWVEPFGDDLIALLRTFADQAVIAIENARLLDELQTRQRELESRSADLAQSLEFQKATSGILEVIVRSRGDVQPVLDAIVAEACRLSGADDAGFVIKEGEILKRVAAHGAMRTFPADHLPIDRGNIVGRAVIERKAIHVRDLAGAKDDFPLGSELALARGHRTALAIPLLQGGTGIGCLFLRKGRLEPFTSDQIGLLNTFADQAVIAIENARLLEELQTRQKELAQSVEELKALGEVSQAVNSTLDLDKVLEAVVAKAVELSATDGGAIYVYDEETQTFELRSTYRMPPELIQTIKDRRVTLGQTAIGRAADLRAPLQVSDVRQEPANTVQQAVLAAGFHALLVVPLIGADRIVGALVVRRKAAGEFPQRTIDLLQTFAAQSVLALQNARLFSEIEDKGRQLAVASQHKSQFLANMSHELRTPLNAILGYTELMQDGIYGELPAKAAGTLGRVQANGKHLLGLINQVLDLSKIEAGQLNLSLSEYSVGSLVESVVAATESLATEKKLKLVTEVQRSMPRGTGDEQRLTQVLLNLVGNAIKFTDQGEVRIRAAASDGRFQIAVADTGPGIPPAEQARIFEEFHQVDSSNTKAKGGTGLGLAIAKRIVEMHGGQISVESKPGKGATFHVELPIEAAMSTATVSEGAAP